MEKLTSFLSLSAVIFRTKTTRWHWELQPPCKEHCAVAFYLRGQAADVSQGQLRNLPPQVVNSSRGRDYTYIAHYFYQ